MTLELVVNHNGSVGRVRQRQGASELYGEEFHDSEQDRVNHFLFSYFREHAPEYAELLERIAEATYRAGPGIAFQTQALKERLGLSQDAAPLSLDESQARALDIRSTYQESLAYRDAMLLSECYGIKNPSRCERLALHVFEGVYAYHFRPKAERCLQSGKSFELTSFDNFMISSSLKVDRYLDYRAYKQNPSKQ